MTTVREHELKLHVLHFALNISQQITICLDVTEMFNINICKHLKCHLFLMVAFISYCTKLPLFRNKNFYNNGDNTTYPFNGLFYRTTWVSRYQKGRTSCPQITTPSPHHSIFIDWVTPNQQCQSTEGTI